MSDDRYDKPERPRYFRESPPREETKEEKRAGVVFLIVLCMLAIAAYITVIDMNLLYLLSIPLGASIAWFLSPRTIEDYYDHDCTKYEQSIALMVSNLLCLMVVTYYNTPVFVAILVYVGIYSITRKALTHDHLQPPSHTPQA